MRDITAIIAAPTDEHCGSTVGLMPPTWETVEGNPIQQNAIQRILWQQWEECWRVVADLRRPAPGKRKKTRPRLIIVNCGDAVDGDHHGTAQLITQRIDEQERLAVACLRHALDLAGFAEDADELRLLAGTPAHVGEGACTEERIARQLLPPARLDGSVLYQRLRRRIAGHLFEFAHHGPGPGARQWTHENPFTWKLKSEYLRRLQRNEEMPRYYVRAHRHQFVVAAPIRDPQGKLICEGFALPSFTFKNDFAQRVAGDSLPNVGMWLAIIYADGATDWQCPLLTYQQDPIIEDVV